MSKRSDRRRQFQFESLERRETPSAVSGGTVQDLARSAGARSGEIHVSAEGTVSGSNVTITSGRSAQIGSISGSIDGTNGVITGTNGNLTLVDFTGTFGKEHNGKESVRGTFSISGGAVGETNVTGGQGTFTGSEYMSADTIHLTLRGTPTE